VVLRRVHVPTLAVDAGLAAAVAAANVVAIAASEEPGSQAPDALAYLLGVAAALPLLVRRRWPLGTLLASAAIVFAYHAFDYPAVGLAVPLSVALFTAAYADRVWAAATVALGLQLMGLGARAIEEGESLISVIGTGTVGDVALMAVVLLLGETLRTRRAWMDEVRERMRRTAEEKEREAQRRVDQERLRIAREVHDVLAHTISAIGVQAGVAADALPDDPRGAQAPVEAIRERTREALRELRAAIGALRDGDASADARRNGDDPAPRAPAPGLARLDDLVATTAAAGVHVDVDIRGAARELPPVVDLAAYRIVQESLTNVVRHAGAAHATLTIAYERDGVRVEVDDDGRGPEGDAAGHGLVGMRERAAAIGGRVEAGAAAPDRGFRVRAWLPTEGVAA